MPTPIQTIANLWKVRYPHLADRIDRAVALTGGVKSQGEGVHVVEGSHGAEYIVWADPETHKSTCTCPDFEKGHKCKHILAVALLWAVNRDR